jgi:hypothetical protein
MFRLLETLITSACFWQKLFFMHEDKGQHGRKWIEQLG